MIDAGKINEIILDCLFKDEEVIDGKPPGDAVLVEGITVAFGFDKRRLESHRNEIAEALSQLPDGFQSEKGGGQSFLNGCMEKSGRQWGEHRNVEQLMCLGLGLELVKYCAPKEHWRGLPGGLPYFAVVGGR